MKSKSKIKHSHNRILQISEDHKQITMPDSRFYRRNGEFYPSITHVLSAYPKGKHFENWLKKMGTSADYIVKKAATEGTQVHEMIEDYLNGKEMKFLDSFDNPKYHPDVWRMFMRFVDFWELYKPKLIETEVHVFSDKLKVAGTCDMVCEIINTEGKAETWIIDFKTSNHLQTTYELQTAVYGQCYEECYGVKADRFGVLWLKSSKRKQNKEKFQGKNWEVSESKRTQEENLEIFLTVKRLFDLENPYSKPIYHTFQTSAKRQL